MASLGDFVASVDLTPTYLGLNYQLTDRNGRDWFITNTGDIVRKTDLKWESFGTVDGVVDRPRRIVESQGGVIIVGSHDSSAAIAEPEGTGWRRSLFPEVAQVLGERTVFRDSRDRVWLTDSYKYDKERHRQGMVIIDGNQHVTVYPPACPETSYGLGELRGRIIAGWFGGLKTTSAVSPQDWIDFSLPWGHDAVDVVFSSGTNLFVAPRGAKGVRVVNSEFETVEYDELSGVFSFTASKDGTVFAVTHEGVRLFDGQSWVPYALPEELIVADHGEAHVERDGMWLNRRPSTWRAAPWEEVERETYKTTRYSMERVSPETMIADVSERSALEFGSGTVSLHWDGADRWDATPKGELTFSQRMDGLAWSPFTPHTSKNYSHLASGGHVLEVRARDRALNVDPSPSRLAFVVLPPVWRDPNVLLVTIVLVVAVSTQSIRLVRRNRERVRVDVERQRLDAQLQQLRYLDKLRTSLAETRSPQQTVRAAGICLVNALESTVDARAEITYESIAADIGEHFRSHSRRVYERPLAWNDRVKGRLLLETSLPLSEAQERVLLDETAGQISRVLEAQELGMQLLQSARLVSMGQMAAGVAHELNQPLGGISATAEDYYLRIQEGLSITPEQWREMLQRILAMVERMTGTVDHLRVFSRDTSQDPGVSVEVNGVIHESLGMIGTQLANHGVTLTLDLAEDLPVVKGHPHQLEQVFLNLLANARDAVDERSDPADPSYQKTIRVETRLSEGGVETRVMDNGVGIPSENVGRLFEPFFTTKPEDRGTGLGLSITYAIVKNHNGDIAVESKEGEGTQFTVTLPV